MALPMSGGSYPLGIRNAAILVASASQPPVVMSVVQVPSGLIVVSGKSQYGFGPHQPMVHVWI